MAKNALDVLKEDHDKVRKLLEELVSTSGEKTRERLLGQIANEVEIHAEIEEEIFYPAFRDAAKKKDQKKLYYEAVEEHRAVGEMVLPDLKETDASTMEFGGRAKVLREMVIHHIEEEEEKLFPLVKKLCSKEELQELGEHLQQRKKELLRERKAA